MQRIDMQCRNYLQDAPRPKDNPWNRGARPAEKPKTATTVSIADLPKENINVSQRRIVCCLDISCIVALRVVMRDDATDALGFTSLPSVHEMCSVISKLGQMPSHWSC